MKNLNLSTSVSVTSTYAGEFAGQYIQAALKLGTTLGTPTITVKENVKYKEVIKKLATGSLIQAGACDFTPTGTVALTEVVLEPKELMVNLQLCKASFRSDWEAMAMGASAHDSLPPKFSDFLIANVSQTVGQEMEGKVWNSTTIFSGITQLLAADATVVDVAGLGTGITSANVQAEIGRVVTAAAALNTGINGDNMVIYASPKIVNLYVISLAGFGASGLGANGYKGEGPVGIGNAPLYFGAYEIIKTPGMPDNQMVCAMKDNLVFATGLMSDENKVVVIDQSPLDGSDNVNIVMKWTGTVAVLIGAEVVYYA